MKVKCSTEWFYETTSEEEMKRNFAIQRKKGRRSVSYQGSKVPLIFNSSLSIQRYYRERPLMTSDIRVGMGVQDIPKNGTL